MSEEAPLPSVDMELREREEQYRGIFESSLNAILIADLGGVIVEANPAACEMYGYEHDELVGLHGRALLHPDYQHVIDDALESIATGEQFSSQAVCRRKDGSAFHSAGRAVCFMYRGTPHILSVGEDITERVKAQDLLEHRVEERTRELTTLLDVARDVASTLEMASLLDRLLDGLANVVPYDGAAVLSREGDELVYLARRAPTPAMVPPQEGLHPEQMRPILDSIRRGEVVIIDDVRGDTELARAFQRHAPDLMDTRHSYFSCWMGLPLMVGEQWIGMLLLTSSRASHYTDHHAELALAVARQAAIAIENARLYAKAQELAALEERQRLARELHDSVTQALYGIGLAAETTRLLLEQEPVRAAHSNQMIHSLARSAMAEMRALIFELRPESLELEGLVGALQKQADALEARHGIPVETSFGQEPEVSLSVKEALYRIGQEALQNAVKHAGPARLELLLEPVNGAVVLEVRDDGVGFDAGGAFPGHLGLKSMRERAARLGGTLEVESAPNLGTRVRARIPSIGRA